MLIRVDRLHKHFGRTKAVDGISFQFESGQIFGFVGPNGAGKTTTMRILATLEEPTAGDAFIDDASVVQDPERVRRLLGFMPDSLPTHLDMTVHDYLDFFARAYGLGGDTRRRVVARVEEFTALAAIRDKFLRALSKGMKQRVSLARAIVHDPPVLVLDEPAAGLDPRARIELRELLHALAALGKAILISSHILTELAEICFGAIIIEQGRILGAGPVERLLQGTPTARIVRIRAAAGDPAELQRRVLQSPGVEQALIAGQEVEARLAGGDEACAELLAALVGAGVRVAEFRQRKADLEQVFMAITRGAVQ